MTLPVLLFFLAGVRFAQSGTDESIITASLEAAQQEGEPIVPPIFPSDDVPINTVAGEPDDVTIESQLKYCEKHVSVLLQRQQDSDIALVRITSRLDILTGALVAISSKLDTMPTRQEMQHVQVLGAPCRDDRECSGVRVDTVCGEGGRCECAAGLQEVAVGRCAPYPRLSESCRRDADCLGAVANSTCVDNACACLPRLLREGDTVCRQPRLSEVCLDSTDCADRHAVCGIEGRCSCPYGFWNDNNITCRAYPRLSDACTSDSQCQVLTENSTCAAGICSCVSGLWQREYTECAPGASHGELCEADAECAVTSARLSCTLGICGCIPSAAIDGPVPPLSKRLRLSDSRCQSGAVQYYDERDDFWYPTYVCGHLTKVEATVICRSFGFVRGQPKPTAEISFWMNNYNNFTCTGDEENIHSCEWSKQDVCGLYPTSIEVSCFTE